MQTPAVKQQRRCSTTARGTAGDANMSSSTDKIKGRIEKRVRMVKKKGATKATSADIRASIGALKDQRKLLNEQINRLEHALLDALLAEEKETAMLSRSRAPALMVDMAADVGAAQTLRPTSKAQNGAKPKKHKTLIESVPQEDWVIETPRVSIELPSVDLEKAWRKECEKKNEDIDRNTLVKEGKASGEYKDMGNACLDELLWLTDTTVLELDDDGWMTSKSMLFASELSEHPAENGIEGAEEDHGREDDRLTQEELLFLTESTILAVEQDGWMIPKRPSQLHLSTTRPRRSSTGEIPDAEETDRPDGDGLQLSRTASTDGSDLQLPRSKARLSPPESRGHALARSPPATRNLPKILTDKPTKLAKSDEGTTVYTKPKYVHSRSPSPSS